MRVEELKALKAELGLTSEMIADSSGIPLSTVQKIFAGVTKSPRYETLLKIEKVLRKEKADRYFYSSEDKDDSVARENNPADLYDAYSGVFDFVKLYEKKGKWNAPGEYTTEDYYRISAEKRIELINGYIYDLGAPSTAHQTIQGVLYTVLFDYSRSKNFSCRPYMSPVDVKLNRDKKTMVQPDVFMIFHNDAVDTRRRIEGAPDFVIEILSSSTKGKDTAVKLNAYLEAGVREYWMVDPINKTVTAYLYDEPIDIKQYTFSDKVPVSISNGELAIDFAYVQSILDAMEIPEEDA